MTMARSLAAVLLLGVLVLPVSAGAQEAPEEPGVNAPPASHPAAEPAPVEPPPPPPEVVAPRRPPPRPVKPAPPPPPPKKIGRPRSRLAAAATRTLFIGGGLTFGFFWPGDVNDHMESWQNSQGGIVVQESGFSGMLLNLVPRFAVSVVPIRFVEITGLMEIGWGPKIITVRNGDSEVFSFVRYSPGATVNAHIPISDRRDSIFLGGGVLYHHLVFKDYSADTVGFRGQIGYKMFTNSIMVEGFLAFDYATGDTGMLKTYNKCNGDPDCNPEMNLNYTSVQIGFNVYYGII